MMGDYQIGERRQRALDEVDRMPQGLRECVHEFGLPIVRACIKSGVDKPARIRELVREIWDGARDVGSQTNGVYGTIDWLLQRSGGQLSAATLMRVLAEHSLTIAPFSPTREMLDASMAEVSGFNVRCTCEEKHKRRLEAALRAAASSLLISKAQRRAIRATKA